MFEFLKEIKHDTIAKEEIAKLLSTNPEALEIFEQTYSVNALHSDNVPENFFEVNSRQAAAMNKNTATIENQQLKNIKCRIVNELLSKTSVWSFDGNSVSIHCGLEAPNAHTVTNEEINMFPEHLRPQLTGNLMKADINEPSYIILLDQYNHFLKEKDPQKRQMYYNMFRQGLDILDLDEITRRIIATNKNSMGYWLPKITQATLATRDLRIPETTIVKVPTTMLQLTRCEYSSLTKTTLDIVNEFCRQAFNLNENQDYFIKTGTYSSKFDFRNARVNDPKEVSEIGEYLLFIHHQALQMASPLSKPIIYGVSTTDEWVVREFIKDTENNPCIYKGLPLHTEYRVFVDFDTKEIIGMSPYWDPATMKQRFEHGNDANSPHSIHDYIIYSMHESTLMQRYEQNKNYVKEFVQKLISNTEDLNGQWSIDIMQNGNEFWMIDMAIAETSALYECVPKTLRRRLPENWLPTLN